MKSFIIGRVSLSPFSYVQRCDMICWQRGRGVGREDRETERTGQREGQRGQRGQREQRGQQRGRQKGEMDKETKGSGTGTGTNKNRNRNRGIWKEKVVPAEKSIFPSFLSFLPSISHSHSHSRSIVLCRVSFSRFLSILHQASPHSSPT